MPEWSPEVVVEEELARRLIREQFPQVEARSLQLLGQGWDNTVWLVDGEWAFRFPRKQFAVCGLGNEIAYLPKLAPLLPLPIPVPTLIGQPSEKFQWPFYGAAFIPGRELAEARLDEEGRVALARPLAEFLRTLHAVEFAADLPVDPVRRTDMPFRVPLARKRLTEVEELGLWQPPRSVDGLLSEAENLPSARPTAVCHGDLHLRHLLIGEENEPAGVIDWIDLSRNDPAVDLVLFWAALPPEGRTVFLDAYGPLSEEQLLRARALSFFLCGVLAVYARHEGLPELEREAVESLARTCL